MRRGQSASAQTEDVLHPTPHAQQTSLLQETWGRPHDLAEFHTLFPTHTASGTFCRGGTSRALAFVVRRYFALQFRHISWRPSSPCNLAILHLEVDDFQLDVVGTHLISTHADGGSAAGRALSLWVTQMLWTPPKTVWKLDRGWWSEHATTCSESSMTHVRLSARWWHLGTAADNTGAVSVLARIDRVRTNLTTSMLRMCNAQARFDTSPLDPTVPSGHLALPPVLAGPDPRPGADGHRQIPRWVLEQPSETS